MFAILQALVRGGHAQLPERMKDEFAVALIDQKVREAESALSLAKDALANLLVRLRRERAALSDLRSRITDLEERTVSALRGGNEKLATNAATLIAELQGEEEARAGTVSRLEERTSQLRLSIERAHRRVVGLRHGAMTARSIERERAAQRQLGKFLREPDPDAEQLICRVLEADDPFETEEARREIDADLNGEAIRERLAEAGHRAPTKPRAADVLARLRASATTDA